MEEKTCCFTGHRKIPADKYQIIAKETEKPLKSLSRRDMCFSAQEVRWALTP